MSAEATRHYALMARYNRWMNERLYALVADIPDAERKQDRGAFFGSVHGTLNHLLYGDKAWFARFKDRDYNLPTVGTDLHTDFEALRADHTALDAEIEAWAESLDPTWLDADFTYKSGIDGKTRTLPAWVLVQQLFNHQTHHRGQLTTLLTQMGLDVGVTDLPWLPEFA